MPQHEDMMRMAQGQSKMRRRKGAKRAIGIADYVQRTSAAQRGGAEGDNPGDAESYKGEMESQQRDVGNQRMLGAMGGIMASGMAKKKKRVSRGQSMQNYQG